jgi:hypothetical protein
MDTRKAFLAWMELGTLKKAAVYLKEPEGMYNKKTGKTFSTSAIRHAACRYIAVNHEEAKPVLLKAWKDQGVKISRREWEAFVVKLAAKYLASSKDRFIRWLEANAWAEKYDYIYARDYGLEQKNSPPV